MSASVRAGYKQTEVGVIPADWEVRAIGDLNPFVTSGSRGWATFYSDRGSLFVRITNMSRDSIYLDLENQKFVNLPVESSEGIRTQLQEHDVLVSITADIGIVSYVDPDVPTPAYINQHIALVRFDQEMTCGKFVSYFLASEKPQRLFRASTDTGAKAGMSLPTVQKIEVALPPIPEQRAIAAALSDVDALLGGLDRLIAKKRHLKQAAMQQLLTGQTRLPGFSGEWEVKTLSEVCWFQEGPGVRNTQFTTSGIKLLNGTNIFRGVLNLDTTTRFISETEAYGPYAHFMAEDGNIVLASSGITIDRLHEKVAFVRRENLPFCMNTSTIRFKPLSGILCSKFLYQFLVGDGFKSQIGGVATGSAQLNFGPSHVARVNLSVPGLPEQTAIAAVLSDMDTELAKLVARRDKTQSLKQAMMQELLTGRIRLV